MNDSTCYKLKKKLIFCLTLFFSAFTMMFPLNVKDVHASTTSNINATIRVNVCGDGIVEGDEECEVHDLQGRTCSNLGYSGGNLLCYETSSPPFTSCTFNVSKCNVPAVNSNNVAPDEVSSLLAAGYLNKPSSDNVTSTSSLTVTTQTTINIPVSGGTSSVILPKDTHITGVDNSNFDPTAFTASAVSTSSLSGFSPGVTVDGALQWGISSTTLEFNVPITLRIHVGDSLNGQTLNVVRSVNLDSGWTTDGIVVPATCLVSSGLCTFQATKASYFATNRTVASTSSSSSSSSDSSTSSSQPSSTSILSSPTSTPTPIITQPEVSLLPSFLNFFDANGNGRLESSELYTAVRMWVDNWKASLTAITNKQTAYPDIPKCDFNQDGQCNVRDLSILLFYVER